MIKQYIKQSVYLLKENKLLSIISVTGVALAITMIMCIVLVFRVRTTNYAPEINRDRTLVVRTAIAGKIGQEGWMSGGLISLKTIKESFYTLETAEKVTAILPMNPRLASAPGGVSDMKCTVTGTDDAFWQVFSFRFLSGKPYGEEYISGEKKAVINRTTARRIFGTEDVVGRTLLLSFVDYTICGVVEDVSILAENAYSEVWVPYTTLPACDENWEDGLLGPYTCCIMAPDKASLDAVHAEATKNVDRMNGSQKDFELKLYGAPDTQLELLARDNIFTEPDVAKLVVTGVVVIVILLLVPAINLSGITLSRMRKRMPEIGIRRAFGASQGELMWQVLNENFVLTLCGGLLGLLLSYISILGLREWVLSTDFSGFYNVKTAVNADMVLSLDVFLYALLFCLLLNMLSAGIPAWRVSRANIIEALK